MAGHGHAAAAIGRRGIRADKREGDGATPRGDVRPVRLWYRSDRVGRPQTRLPVRPIRHDDGWCDEPSAAQYNRFIRLPANPSHERLWREDHVYDLVIETNHNALPRVRGRGSAIFIHLASDGFGPTAGCVALRPAEMRRLLAKISPKTRIKIR